MNQNVLLAIAASVGLVAGAIETQTISKAELVAAISADRIATID